MGSLQSRVEPDPPERSEPPTELDVLDRRPGIPLLVESSRRHEGAPADGADARPERAQLTRRATVDGVVEEIAERGHGADRHDRVVVGAEERNEAGVTRERLADPGEGIAVDEHVRVD